MPTKTVFLDTQVFLHYRAIRDIDWCDLCHSERVSIIIAPIVIEELDKKKIDRDQKIKKRAARAIKEISELLEASPNGLSAVLRSGVELCFYPNEPMEFDVYSLDASHPDDRLIATLLSYQKRDQSLDCMLISEDLGCRLKAKARHIALGRMPESAKLTEEPDPNEQRVRELEEENQHLRLGSPKLSLAFLDKCNAAHYSIEVDVSLPSELATPSEIRHKHPKFDTPGHNRRALRITSPRVAFGEMENWIDRYREKYNENLDKYYASYAEYYRKESVWRMQERHFIQMDLMLINDGGAPAHDARVIITLPGNLIVNKRKKHPIINYEPSAPPQKAFDSLTSRMGLDREFMDYDPEANNRIDHTLLSALSATTAVSTAATKSDLEIERVTEKDTIDVSYSMKLLQHGFKEHIPPIFIFFADEMIKSFSVSCQIHASNLRTPVQGKLHVAINQ